VGRTTRFETMATTPQPKSKFVSITYGFLCRNTMKSKPTKAKIIQHLSENLLLFLKDAQLTNFGIKIPSKEKASFVLETTD